MNWRDSGIWVLLGVLALVLGYMALNMPTFNAATDKSTIGAQSPGGAQ
jgi:uncharacterized membrane protein HdeD (DUF308 family)